MNYLVAGTWRELHTDGVMENFKLEIEASSEEEARNIVHSNLYWDTYKDILIKTVIADFDGTKKDIVLQAKFDAEETVYISIVELDAFVFAEPDNIIYLNVGDKIFYYQRMYLSEFCQI